MERLKRKFLAPKHESSPKPKVEKLELPGSSEGDANEADLEMKLFDLSEVGTDGEVCADFPSEIDDESEAIFRQMDLVCSNMDSTLKDETRVKSEDTEEKFITVEEMENDTTLVGDMKEEGELSKTLEGKEDGELSETIEEIDKVILKTSALLEEGAKPSNTSQSSSRVCDTTAAGDDELTSQTLFLENWDDSDSEDSNDAIISKDSNVNETLDLFESIISKMMDPSADVHTADTELTVLHAKAASGINSLDVTSVADVYSQYVELEKILELTFDEVADPAENDKQTCQVMLMSLVEKASSQEDKDDILQNASQEYIVIDEVADSPQVEKEEEEVKEDEKPLGFTVADRDLAVTIPIEQKQDMNETVDNVGRNHELKLKIYKYKNDVPMLFRIVNDEKWPGRKVPDPDTCLSRPSYLLKSLRESGSYPTLAPPIPVGLDATSYQSVSDFITDKSRTINTHTQNKINTLHRAVEFLKQTIDRKVEMQMMKLQQTRQTFIKNLTNINLNQASIDYEQSCYLNARTRIESQRCGEIKKLESKEAMLIEKFKELAFRENERVRMHAHESCSFNSMFNNFKAKNCLKQQVQAGGANVLDMDIYNGGDSEDDIYYKMDLLFRNPDTLDDIVMQNRKRPKRK